MRDSAPFGAPSGLVKVSFHIPESEWQGLETIARLKGITRTHALRQAIATKVLLVEQIEAGGSVIVELPRGRPRYRMVD